MGVGTSAAGAGGAGLDPPQIVTLPTLVIPEALRFDGASQDWELDELAVNYRGVTSTEQGMIISICWNQGQISSSIETGNTLDKIKYLGRPDLQADVEDRLFNANPAKALIAAGKAKYTKVVVTTQGTRLFVQAFFKALDAPNARVLQGSWSRT